MICPLSPHQATASALTILVQYTDPEIAHVGMSEEDAGAKGMAVRTVKVEPTEVGRAILDGETDGFVKIHVLEESDELLGATIVAAHAGDLRADSGHGRRDSSGTGGPRSLSVPDPGGGDPLGCGSRPPRHAGLG